MEKYLHSSHVSYDPTMHLAQEFVTVAHHNNPAEAKLSKHKLTITLPINADQYTSIKRHAGFWY